MPVNRTLSGRINLLRIPLPAKILTALVLFFASSHTVTQTNVAAQQLSFGADPDENRVAVRFITKKDRISETDSPFWVGLHMDIKEGWHVYWRNPGDSGLPTRITWSDSDDVEPGEIHWPLPSRFDEEGITTYGYSDEVTLLIPVSLSRMPITGESIALEANVQWLVCKDICIPESARVPFEIGGRGELQGLVDHGGDRISGALSLLPQPSDAWSAEAFVAERELTLDIRPESAPAIMPNPENVYFYPYHQGVIEHTAPQKVSVSDEKLTLTLQVSRYYNSGISEIRGVLVTGTSWIEGESHTGLEISAEIIPTY
ncbi:protein-disulfide reductase DsbD family protein [Balneolales bacterium ANBcel1]|nr:protein-disulfide reductase DsbD family protein [Balneolales bacterium ANBcel1]